MLSTLLGPIQFSDDDGDDDDYDDNLEEETSVYRSDGTAANRDYPYVLWWQIHVDGRLNTAPRGMGRLVATQERIRPLTMFASGLPTLPNGPRANGSVPAAIPPQAICQWSDPTSSTASGDMPPPQPPPVGQFPPMQSPAQSQPAMPPPPLQQFSPPSWMVVLPPVLWRSSPPPLRFRCPFHLRHCQTAQLPPPTTSAGGWKACPFHLPHNFRQIMSID
ncbi:hypothetical protein BHE74_00008536 [Ensete ventricosum]|nr:hypothetical protein BHE74_00008536 [Ensete ventricosum]